jgi:hypothetical protein
MGGRGADLVLRSEGEACLGCADDRFEHFEYRRDEEA